MTREIKIGTQIIAVEANAATPIRFRNLFGKDLLTTVQEGTRENGIDLTVASEIAPELAFLMTKTAEKADLSKLNQNQFFEWLEQFGPLDMVNATEAIFTAYFGDASTLVESKKKEGKRKEN